MNNFRGLVRNGILDILGTFPCLQNGIHILNGHMIYRRAVSDQARDYFSYQLKQLFRYVHFIRVEEATSPILNHKSVDEPLVTFTFDDGFMECHSVIAPVLEQSGVNAAFFISPNLADRDDVYIQNFASSIVLTPDKIPMRWAEMRDLQPREHVIGAHTVDHYTINDNDLAELDKQIGCCKSVIEHKLSTPCKYFAFPYGRLKHANQSSIGIACKYYRYVFSQSDYKHCFSFGGRVINRRHLGPF